MTDASSPVHVAFVRAVMIGREGLDRPVLLDMFTRAGAADARSYLATGNVSFRAEPRAVAGIVDAVEHDLEALLGRATPIFVRSLTELVALVERDVFASEPLDAVAARLVTFFRSGVPSGLTLPVRAPNGDWSVFAAGAREVFSVTRAQPDRQPRDPGGVIQRLAGEPVTTRAVGTLERIVATLT